MPSGKDAFLLGNGIKAGLNHKPSSTADDAETPCKQVERSDTKRSLVTQVQASMPEPRRGSFVLTDITCYRGLSASPPDLRVIVRSRSPIGPSALCQPIRKGALAGCERVLSCNQQSPTSFGDKKVRNVQKSSRTTHC